MATPAHRSKGFSLVELLTVIFIIAILLGLVFGAISGVFSTAKRSRAKSEIKTMESALESYKADNGAYPIVPAGTGFLSTSDYTTQSPLAPGKYQNSSAYLYEQLSGNTASGYQYASSPTPAGHVYFPFKHIQLGNDQPASGPVYIKDPFGASYGYYAGATDTTTSPPTVNYPNNGVGQYDLWSTAGDTTSPPTMTAKWVTDWGN